MNNKQETVRRNTVYGRRASDRRGTLERHAQTVLVSLVILLIGWVGVSITELRDTVQSIRGDVLLVSERVNLMQKQIDLTTNTLYTTSQAAADLRLRDQRIEENARRIGDLERRVTGAPHPKGH